MPPPRGWRELYASEFGDGARSNSGSDPELFDGDFFHHLADAQALGAYAQLAAAFHGDRHAAARDGAEAALVEDVFVVEAAPPALEVADLGARVARVDRHAAQRLDFDEHRGTRRELLRRVEHVGG